MDNAKDTDEEFYSEIKLLLKKGLTKDIVSQVLYIASYECSRKIIHLIDLLKDSDNKWVRKSQLLLLHYAILRNCLDIDDKFIINLIKNCLNDIDSDIRNYALLIIYESEILKPEINRYFKDIIF